LLRVIAAAGAVKVQLDKRTRMIKDAGIAPEGATPSCRS
jgi:hypothetical protein